MGGLLAPYQLFKTRSYSIAVTFIQIANTNNCIAFGDYMTHLRKRYLKDEMESKDEYIYIRKDRFQTLTDEFNKIGSFGLVSLLWCFYHIHFAGLNIYILLIYFCSGNHILAPFVLSIFTIANFWLPGSDIFVDKISKCGNL